MSKNDKESLIGFALNKITTEQFAIIEKHFNDNDNIEIKLSTHIKFGIDPSDKIVVVFPAFIYEQNNSPFLVIEMGCHFKIKDESWNSFLNKDENSITFPKDFIAHLSVISVGTSRGTLHAKTEKTRFNKFILPTINLHQLIKNDLTFSKLSVSSDKVDYKS